MAGDADLINFNSPIIQKGGTGDILTPSVYNVRVYAGTRKVLPHQGGLRVTPLATPAGTYSIVEDTDTIVKLVGNASGGTKLTFMDPGDGGPYFADATLLVGAVGEGQFTLTKDSGDPELPATQVLQIKSVPGGPPTEYTYEYRAYQDGAVTLGLEIATWDENSAFDIRFALVRFLAGVPDGFEAAPSDITFDLTATGITVPATVAQLTGQISTAAISPLSAVSETSPILLEPQSGPIGNFDDGTTQNITWVPLAVP